MKRIRIEPAWSFTDEAGNRLDPQLFEGVEPVLRMHASHGYAVALLPRFASDFQLDLQYCSPQEALAALNRGACDVAGYHMPTSATRGPLMQGYRRQLRPRSHCIIRFITRCQGLMVRPGNPKGIAGLADLSRGDVRFINRQKASGTRALLDILLRDAGLSSQRIPGFELEEYTHSAVAAYIAAGMADVGFGVEAAAHQFGLAFLPLAQEHYLLVCQRRSLTDPSVKRLLEMIRSEPFLQAVSELPGYSPNRCGEVCSVDELFDETGNA